jgi:hypothetical protein
MGELVHEARKELGLYLDGDLANFLGVSRRTVQRHANTAGIPIGDGHTQLVRALYPQNPDLALKIARPLKIDLSDLIAAAQATPPARSAGGEHAALILLAACDALDKPPREVRPVLAAIFRKARELGVDLDQLAKLLAEGDGAKR